MTPVNAGIETVLLKVIFQLIVIIAAARLSGQLFRSLGQPAVCGEIGAGEYPESMDMAGVTKLITKFALKEGKDFSDEKMQKLMKESVQIGRGFQFGLLGHSLVRPDISPP